MTNGTSDLRYFQVAGNNYEMGFSQGELFRERLDTFLDGVKAVPWLSTRLWPLIPRSALKLLLSWHGKRELKRNQELLSTFAGGLWQDRLQGVCDGAQSALPLMLGMNAFEVLSAQVPVQLGCTALAFAPWQTSFNQGILAYNHDFPLSFAPHACVRKNMPQNGFSSLSLTYPAIIGAIAGVNEKGLALALNHAYANETSRIPALYLTMLLQYCLDTFSNTNELLAFFADNPVSTGSILTALDLRGDRLAVEFAPSRRQFRQVADHEVLHTFNRYLQPGMEQVEVPINGKGTRGAMKGLWIHEPNMERERRFEELMKADLRYTAEDIHELMSDHAGEVTGTYTTICRHHEKTADTIVSAQINPHRRSIDVIWGHPCEEAAYHRFDLFERAEIPVPIGFDRVLRSETASFPTDPNPNRPAPLADIVRR